MPREGAVVVDAGRGEQPGGRHPLEGGRLHPQRLGRRVGVDQDRLVTGGHGVDRGSGGTDPSMASSSRASSAPMAWMQVTSAAAWACSTVTVLAPPRSMMLFRL